MNTNVEKLIKLVQANPCLYDCRDEDFKNALRKDIVWEEIAKKLDRRSDHIKCKWKNLKDCYSKYKKGTTHKQNKYLNWVWGPYLTFLDGAIQKKGTSSNVDVSSPSLRIAKVEVELLDTNDAETDTEIKFNRKTENYEAGSGVHDDLMGEEPRVPAYSLLQTSYAPRKRQLSDDRDFLVDKVLEYIDINKKKDSIDLLFASYAESVKRMKPATQASVKIKLAQIFAEAELQDQENPLLPF